MDDFAHQRGFSARRLLLAEFNVHSALLRNIVKALFFYLTGGLQHKRQRPGHIKKEPL
jgi:hypothetical protein